MTSRACTGLPHVTLTEFLQRRDSVEKLPTLRTRQCHPIGIYVFATSSWNRASMHSITRYK